MSRTIRHTTLLTFAAVALTALMLPALAGAFEPTKWVLSSTIGSNVNKTQVQAGAPQEERNQCTVASNDECQPGMSGSEPRGFYVPEGVAVSALTGDVYVADALNHRVQVLGANGEFLLMFGWNVNKTKVAAGAAASQQEKNLCTAASHDQCGAGEHGTGLAGQFSHPQGITVDPSSGDVYVLDTEYSRVDVYTPTGEFVSMIGGEVNKKGGDVCTKAEESECQTGTEGEGEREFSDRELKAGANLLSFGPEGDLYVGQPGRIEKLEADGAWVGEISLAELSPSKPVEGGVAVDPNGDVLVAVTGVAGIHEYSPSGQLQSCVINSAESSNGFIKGIALDVYGRLAVSWRDEGIEHVTLYQTQGSKCGETVGGEIVPPSGQVTGLPAGLAFSFSAGSEDRLYMVKENESDIEAYAPAVFPEVRTCATGGVLFTSANLCGEINPNGLATTGFFEYGVSEEALSSQTPAAFSGDGIAFEPVSYELGGLTPNQTYYDEMFAQAEVEGKPVDAGAPPPVSFHTSTPPPEVPGAPEVLTVGEQSAVLRATVNPEHAATRSHFEYAACASEAQAFAQCAAAQNGAELESGSLYGAVGVTGEITGLAPQTVYAYRLVSDNQFEYEGATEGGQSEGQEGHFTTGALAVPRVQTGSASMVTTTGALVSGTVEPDGTAATYAFELGLYNGASTQYGIVLSGPVAAGPGPVEEQLELSGLQPGTTYAYRIAIKSGYLTSSNEATQGEARVFTTGGLPAVLESPPALALLAIPTTKFPTKGKPTVKCKRVYRHNKHGECVKTTKHVKKADARKHARAGSKHRRK